MSNRLNEMILEISRVHETLISNGMVNNIDDVLDFIKDFDDDVKSLYLKSLLQYYFQRNQVNNVQELLALGFTFDITMEDIKFAFYHINSEDESVIELFEKELVFFRDVNHEQALNEIYQHYHNSNSKIQAFLEPSVSLLKKNIYLCGFCHKNAKEDYAKFFIDKELLSSLKQEMPFLV